MKRKVLILPTAGFGVDGISNVVISHINGIENVEIVLLVTKRICDDNSFKAQMDKVGKKCAVIAFKRSDVLSYFFELLSFIRKSKFDFVHIHGSSSLMSLELLVSYVGGVKNRITHSHNTTCNHLLLNKLLKPIFHLLTTIRLACGTDAGKWLYGNRDFTIINNGIDVEKFIFNSVSRDQVRSELKVRDNMVIGHVGAFNEQKNHKFLIGVFSEVVKICKNSILVLVGDGSKRTEIEELVQKMKLEGHVMFLGRRNDVNQLLSGFDIMVLPSIHEGLPLVAIEWQAAGLPIIASDCVTKEVKLTELITFMNLNQSHIEWAKAIIVETTKYCQNNRSHYNALIKDEGFDTTDAIKKLGTLYEKCN